METKKVLFFNKLSFALLLITVAGSIFFFVPYMPITLGASKGFLIAIGASLSLFFWLIARLGEGSFHIPKDRVMIAGAVIPLVFLISSFFSSSKYLSFFGGSFESGTVASIFVLFVLFFLSSMYFQTERRFWYFYVTLFAGAGVLALSEFIFIGANLIKPNLLGSMFQGLSSGNLFGSWNDFALFFGLITLLSLYTIELLKTKGVFKFLQYFFLVFGFVFLALINIPLVWLLVSIFSIIIFIYSISFQRAGVLVIADSEHKKKFPFTAMISVFICFIFIVGHTVIGGLISRYISLSNTDVRPSLSATSSIALKAIRHNPVFGTGPNTFGLDWSKWKDIDVVQTLFWNVDFNTGIGLLPTFAITTGLIGLIAWLAFLGLLLFKGFQSLKFTVKDRMSNYFVVSLLMVMTYSWTVSIVYTANIVMFMIALVSSGVFVGMLVHKKSIKVNEFSFLSDPRHSFFAILILMGLIIGTMSLSYLFAEKFVSLSYFAKGLSHDTTIEGLSRAESQIKVAIALDANDAYSRALSQIYISQMNVIINDKTLSEDRLKASIQQLVNYSQEAAQLAVSQNKKQYINYLNLGNVYGSLVPLQVEKSYENAVIAYDRALELAPNNPNVVLSRAQLEFVNKNTEQSFVFVDKALALKANYVEALLFKAQLYMSQSNTSDALLQLEQAIAYDPNNGDLYLQLGQLRTSVSDFKGAVIAFENAVILNPTYLSNRYYLGKAYQKVGASDKALVQFKILEQIEPDNADVKEAIRSVSQGAVDTTTTVDPKSEKTTTTNDKKEN
jgi:tetratricopeptide (TPR) repeat protein